jgi:rhodanese-related sulfurtransferase
MNMSKLDYFKARIEATLSPMEYMQTSKANPGQFVLVDVRNAPPEKMGKKISGALQISQQALVNRLSELPKDKTIVVYCWDTWCNLASLSAITLLENGYDVVELIGGIAAWEAIGFPTESLL